MEALLIEHQDIVNWIVEDIKFALPSASKDGGYTGIPRKKSEKILKLYKQNAAITSLAASQANRAMAEALNYMIRLKRINPDRAPPPVFLIDTDVLTFAAIYVAAENAIYFEKPFYRQALARGILPRVFIHELNGQSHLQNRLLEYKYVISKFKAPSSIFLTKRKRQKPIVQPHKIPKPREPVKVPQPVIPRKQFLSYEFFSSAPLLTIVNKPCSGDYWFGSLILVYLGLYLAGLYIAHKQEISFFKTVGLTALGIGLIIYTLTGGNVLMAAIVATAHMLLAAMLRMCALDDKSKDKEIRQAGGNTKRKSTQKRPVALSLTRLPLFKSLNAWIRGKTQFTSCFCVFGYLVIMQTDKQAQPIIERGPPPFFIPFLAILGLGGLIYELMHALMHVWIHSVHYLPLAFHNFKLFLIKLHVLRNTSFEKVILARYKERAFLDVCDDKLFDLKMAQRRKDADRLAESLKGEMPEQIVALSYLKALPVAKLNILQQIKIKDSLLSLIEHNGESRNPFILPIAVSILNKLIIGQKEIEKSLLALSRTESLYHLALIETAEGLVRLGHLKESAEIIDTLIQRGHTKGYLNKRIQRLLKSPDIRAYLEQIRLQRLKQEDKLQKHSLSTTKKHEKAVNYLIAKRKWARLAKLGPQIAPLLIDALAARRRQDHQEIRQILSKMWPKSAIALMRGTRHHDRHVRLWSVEILIHCGYFKGSLIKKALKDKDIHLRFKAARAYMNYARPAVKMLLENLEHQKKYDRRVATWLLGELIDLRLATVAIEHLADAHLNGLKLATAMTDEILQLGEIAIPHLVTASKDPDAKVKRNAEEALRKAGEKRVQHYLSLGLYRDARSREADKYVERPSSAPLKRNLYGMPEEMHDLSAGEALRESKVSLVIAGCTLVSSGYIGNTWITLGIIMTALYAALNCYIIYRAVHESMHNIQWERIRTQKKDISDEELIDISLKLAKREPIATSDGYRDQALDKVADPLVKRFIELHDRCPFHILGIFATMPLLTILIAKGISRLTSAAIRGIGKGVVNKTKQAKQLWVKTAVYLANLKSKPTQKRRSLRLETKVERWSTNLRRLWQDVRTFLSKRLISSFAYLGALFNNIIALVKEGSKVSNLTAWRDFWASLALVFLAFIFDLFGHPAIGWVAISISACTAINSLILKVAISDAMYSLEFQRRTTRKKELPEKEMIARSRKFAREVPIARHGRRIYKTALNKIPDPLLKSVIELEAKIPDHLTAVLATIPLFPIILVRQLFRSGRAMVLGVRAKSANFAGNRKRQLMRIAKDISTQITRIKRDVVSKFAAFSQIDDNLWQLSDRKTGARLLIDVAHGFNVVGYYAKISGKKYNLIYKDGGAPILFPFANRIRLNENNELEWTDSEGRQWKEQLLSDELNKSKLITQNDKHSVRHGLVRRLPFTIICSGKEANGGLFVTGECRLAKQKYPLLPGLYDGLTLQITYTLQDGAWV
ncbi:MAG: hypothetical protein JW869_05505, partial [Candidatus Omnitrophica bacterium]|nr:hypothetical protein [Candidatus Omnitrophota bacterium]